MAFGDDVPMRKAARRKLEAHMKRERKRPRLAPVTQGGANLGLDCLEIPSRDREPDAWAKTVWWCIENQRWLIERYPGIRDCRTVEEVRMIGCGGLTPRTGASKLRPILIGLIHPGGGWRKYCLLRRMTLGNNGVLRRSHDTWGKDERFNVEESWTEAIEGVKRELKRFRYPAQRPVSGASR